MDADICRSQLALLRSTPVSSAGWHAGEIFTVENDAINISDATDVQSTRRAHSESIRPRDLPLDYKDLLTNGLLADFLAQTGCGIGDCWPWEEATQYLNSLNSYPMIACCAHLIGALRGDNSLKRIAAEAYHHALRFVRFCCSADVFVAKTALALIVATSYLATYEVRSRPYCDSALFSMN
jgi:hypothetical protein